MRTFCLRFLTVLCALYLSGAHWLLLQATAWTGMLVSRTQEMGIVAAVSSTFDGDHPCKMCTAIKETRDTESERTPASVLKDIAAKIFVIIPERTALPQPEQTSISYAAIAESGEARTFSPPTPPPRLS